MKTVKLLEYSEVGKERSFEYNSNQKKNTKVNPMLTVSAFAR